MTLLLLLSPSVRTHSMTQRRRTTYATVSSSFASGGGSTNLSLFLSLFSFLCPGAWIQRGGGEKYEIRQLQRHTICYRHNVAKKTIPFCLFAESSPKMYVVVVEYFPPRFHRASLVVIFSYIFMTFLPSLPSSPST